MSEKEQKPEGKCRGEPKLGARAPNGIAYKRPKWAQTGATSPPIIPHFTARASNPTAYTNAGAPNINAYTAAEAPDITARNPARRHQKGPVRAAFFPP